MVDLQRIASCALLGGNENMGPVDQSRHSVPARRAMLLAIPTNHRTRRCLRLDPRAPQMVEHQFRAGLGVVCSRHPDGEQLGLRVDRPSVEASRPVTHPEKCGITRGSSV